MLGCHDFCGYYEWTFHYLRRRYGVEAVEKYWSQAIAADSQRHYLSAAADRGLRGLYESWLKTGDDEKCDWSVTLDEAQNLLRLDMRECPSKGFLLQNNLNADEDYCDHCMGWIAPALTSIGAEVAAHEHNHYGQCFWEIREAGQPQPAGTVPADIRTNARWSHGYVHRYSHHTKLPFDDDSHTADSCDVIINWFQSIGAIVVANDQSLANAGPALLESSTAIILSGSRYAASDFSGNAVRGVILEHTSEQLPAIAKRFKAEISSPMLLHPYLPSEPKIDFVSHGLPRPVPLLPILIRAGVYDHSAWSCSPTSAEFAEMLLMALRQLCASK